jgi:hypothetical protein
MMQDVPVKLNPVLPSKKQRSKEIRLFSPANWTYIEGKSGYIATFGT